GVYGVGGGVGLDVIALRPHPKDGACLHDRGLPHVLRLGVGLPVLEAGDHATEVEDLGPVPLGLDAGEDAVHLRLGVAVDYDVVTTVLVVLRRRLRSLVLGVGLGVGRLLGLVLSKVFGLL